MMSRENDPDGAASKGTTGGDNNRSSCSFKSSRSGDNHVLSSNTINDNQRL